jgi:hypothetical protein
MTLAALVATIWAAVTGFYGTRHWSPIDVCRASYRGHDLVLVQASVTGRRRVVALRFAGAGRGWTVVWADGRVNRKVAPSATALVLDEVTRLKAKCLAP